ncbi:hypothetical protein HDU84_007562 [Entophlyctis sp. JEL0112]|nr:hypothetical protein HDU84_007562 [Entophlyctis sp. JEL0112]
MECDQPVDSVRALSGTYPDMFSAVLQRGAKDLAVTLSFSVFDVVNDPSATARAAEILDSIDVVLMTGSRHGVNDGLEWTGRLIEFVRLAEATNRIKIIGICFGHQIVATAFGGKVERNTNSEGYTGKADPEGWEIGWTEMGLTDEGKRFFGAGVKEKPCFYSMHKDKVTVCPPGFKNLISTSMCTYQSLVKGNSVLTIQAHPEFSADVVRELILLRRGKVFNEEFGNEALDMLEKHPDIDSMFFVDQILKFVLA